MIRRVAQAAWTCALVAGLWAAPVPAEQAWSMLALRGAQVHYTAGDAALAPAVGEDVQSGMQRIEVFFGHPFRASFEVFMFPGREHLDAQWQEAWGAPEFKSECWMVASGVAQRLDLLSPNAWGAEACEHNATDRRATAQLITHELVHVYHGQHNPVPDFTGMDDLAWLIEGVATYASGQLDEGRMTRVRQLVAKGEAPKSLSGFWSGRDKYGLAGSLARYVDGRFGRARLFESLNETSQEAVLAKLGVTERQLIEAWADSVGQDGALEPRDESARQNPAG
jgi:hypothetical protein